MQQLIQMTACISGMEAQQRAYFRERGGFLHQQPEDAQPIGIRNGFDKIKHSFFIHTITFAKLIR